MTNRVTDYNSVQGYRDVVEEVDVASLVERLESILDGASEGTGGQTVLPLGAYQRIEDLADQAASALTLYAKTVEERDEARERLQQEGHAYEASLEREDDWEKAHGELLARANQAEQERDEALGGWRAIESAPKDGTRFLSVIDGAVRVIAWGKTSHVPIYGFCLADQGAEDFDVCTVKTWRPLPAPPSPTLPETEERVEAARRLDDE